MCAWQPRPLLDDKCALPPVQVGRPVPARHQIADMQSGDRQERPARFHTGIAQGRRARASAGVATATHGNARAPRSTPGKRGASRRPGLSTVRTGTAAWLQRLHPSCHCGQPLFASQELPTLLSATPARCQGHRPQHHVVAAHRRQGVGATEGPQTAQQGHGCLERAQDTATRHIRLKLAYSMLREVGISALDRRQAVSPRGLKRRGCMQPG